MTGCSNIEGAEALAEEEPDGSTFINQHESFNSNPSGLSPTGDWLSLLVQRKSAKKGPLSAALGMACAVVRCFDDVVE